MWAVAHWALLMLTLAGMILSAGIISGKWFDYTGFASLATFVTTGFAAGLLSAAYTQAPEYWPIPDAS